MAALLGGANVVVTRAGATTILELAALAKPTILIPNGKLTGGHQLKNAVVYSDAGAVVVVDEQSMIDNPAVLRQAIKRILTEPETSAAMTKKFSTFAKPHAARDMADMILDAVK